MNYMSAKHFDLVLGSLTMAHRYYCFRTKPTVSPW